MEKKHAFLIIAHSQKNLLRTLLTLLDHPRAHIFLHVDRKASFSPGEFSSVLKKASFTATRRLDVRWGGRSQIDCEFLLLREAIKGEFGYYHLLSGVDLPLRRMDEIFSFFDKNEGREFVNVQSPRFPDELRERFSVRWFFQEVERKNGIYYRLNHTLANFQKKLGFDRTEKEKLNYYKGSNWFSITHELANALLAEEKSIKRRYTHTRCCDEIFLQTFLMNSPFRHRLYDDSLSNTLVSNMRFVDWKRGNPYTFRLEDVDELMSSGLLFARKFDENTSSDAIERICQILKE